MLCRALSIFLSPIFFACPDLFGMSTNSKSYGTNVGFAEKLKHMMLDSTRAFQVPELVLHLFSMRQTNQIDTRAFFLTFIAGNSAVESMATARAPDFEDEVRRENSALNRLRAKTGGTYCDQTATTPNELSNE